jgi:hypothetical protein
MKNIIKHILIITLTFTIVVSCRDEDSVRFPDVAEGVNARLVLYPERSFINFSDLSSASVAFDIYSQNTNIEELLYTITFVDASSPNTVYPPVEAVKVPGSSFVNGKITEIELTADELAALIGLPGGKDFFDGGDKISFTTRATLTDGRVFTAANSAPSITGGAAASFTTQFDVFVGCPSPQDAIAGEYWAIMEYNDASEPIGDSVDVTVEFVGPEPFRYNVTDHTVELYVPYGGTQYEADFYDICGEAILQPATSFGNVVNYVDPADPNFLTATIDTSKPQTEFVLNWHETFNNIKASVRFVKKP